MSSILHNIFRQYIDVILGINTEYKGTDKVQNSQMYTYFLLINKKCNFSKLFFLYFLIKLFLVCLSE